MSAYLEINAALVGSSYFEMNYVRLVLTINVVGNWAHG